jgi:hypothetical protein
MDQRHRASASKRSGGSDRGGWGMNRRVHALASAFYGLGDRLAVYEYPVAEMQKRGWITASGDFSEIKASLLVFFKVKTVEQLLALSFSGDGATTAEQSGSGKE